MLYCRAICAGIPLGCAAVDLKTDFFAAKDVPADRRDPAVLKKHECTSFETLEQHEISSRISTVFQDPRSQFFAVNSTDEVAFGCENLSFSTERINENVEKAFSHLNIGKLKDRSIFQLSSGEKQRLAVASVYAMSTDVI